MRIIKNQNDVTFTITNYWLVVVASTNGVNHYEMSGHLQEDLNTHDWEFEGDEMDDPSKKISKIIRNK